MILWGMLNINLHDRRQAAVRKTVVGVRTSFHSPVITIRELRRFCGKYEGYRSDGDIGRSSTPRCHHLTQQDEVDVSSNVPEETTTGPSHQEQSKKGRGMRWKASLLTPNQAQFEHEEETVQDRDGWTPLDYIQQYIDKDLMEMIEDCSNATSLARSGDPLNTTADEMCHFFGACIVMSCVPYPAIRMYWSRSMRFPAIAENFTRDRVFTLTRSLRVLVVDDVPEDLRECDKVLEGETFSQSHSERLQISGLTTTCFHWWKDDSIHRSLSMSTISANEIKPSWHEKLCLRNIRWNCAGLWHLSRCKWLLEQVGDDLVEGMMSYYCRSGHTKKWTLRMLTHIMDLALADSWLL